MVEHKQVSRFLKTEQLNGSEPFPIRAHHLYWFFKAENRNGEGSTLDAMNSVKATVNELVSNVEKCGDPHYIRDAVGDTPVQRESVIYSLENVFDSFNSLSDDLLVTVNSSPDLICKSCPIGRHCERQQHYGDDYFTRSLYTHMYHRSLFLKEELAIPYPFEEEFHFSLNITAGVLKKTFAFMRENDWQF